MKIDKFHSLDNQHSHNEIGIEGLTVAQNIDITRSNRIISRNGYTKTLDTPIIAMASDNDIVLFIANNNLMRLNSSLASADVMATDLSDSPILTACFAHNKLYWSNQDQNGSIKNGDNTSLPIGIPIPPAPIIETEPIGSLPLGDYLCAYTYINDIGEEGAASKITALRNVELGLSFQNLDTPGDNITHIGIYLTQPNGKILYRVKVIPSSTNSLTYSNNTSELKFQLRTQYLDSLPTGHIIKSYRGRLLIAKDNYLFYSESYNLELYNPLKNFVAFNSRITNVGVSRNGVFVTTADETILLLGQDPTKWEYVELAKYGAIAGTINTIDEELIGIEGIPGNTKVNYWATKKGLVIGMDDGTLRNLTAKYFHFDTDANKGTSVLRSENGQNHIITITN